MSESKTNALPASLRGTDSAKVISVIETVTAEELQPDFRYIGN